MGGSFATIRSSLVVAGDPSSFQIAVLALRL